MERKSKIKYLVDQCHTAGRAGGGEVKSPQINPDAIQIILLVDNN